MNSPNVRRLLHTVVPFCLFVLVQRGLNLVLMRIPAVAAWDPAVSGLLSFTPAAFTAILTFRLRTYAPEEEADPVPPMTRVPVLPACLAVLSAGAAMIVSMYGTATIFRDTDAAVPAQTLASALSLVVIHPVAEEYIFRHLFHGELRRMNPLFGCVTQAVMFAIVHDSVDGMMYALISGIVLGITVEFTGRLWPAILAHALINFRSFACLTFLAGRDTLIWHIDRVFLITGMVAFVLFNFLRTGESVTDPEPDRTTSEILPAESEKSEKSDESDESGEREDSRDE